MDLSGPGRGLASGLSTPILRTLAGRSSPVTATQVARMSGEGTVAGTRRALDRLVSHGICHSDESGDRVVYALNYDHVLYPAVSALLQADRELLVRLRERLQGWSPEPTSAVLFGSAARRDGDLDSDVDLLLLRNTLTTDRARQEWARQVHELRLAVKAWTGNDLHVLDWSPTVLRRHASRGERLLHELLEDGIVVHGQRLTSLLTSSA